MAFFSGNGGGVTVNGGVEKNVGRWEIDHRVRLAENTHSGTNGASNYESVVQDNSGSVDIPVDDTDLPEVDMLIIAGNKIALVGQLGTSGKTCVLTNTTVESVVYINDPSGDIVRARVSFKGGAFTGPVT